MTLLIESIGKLHLLCNANNSDHLAEAILEAMPIRLGEIVQLVFTGIDAAPRLPPTKPITETGDQLQSWTGLAV